MTERKFEGKPNATPPCFPRAPPRFSTPRKRGRSGFRLASFSGFVKKGPELNLPTKRSRSKKVHKFQKAREREHQSRQQFPGSKGAKSKWEMMPSFTPFAGKDTPFLWVKGVDRKMGRTMPFHLPPPPFHRKGGNKKVAFSVVRSFSFLAKAHLVKWFMSCTMRGLTELPSATAKAPPWGFR